jgi:hypothetical protein
VLEFMHATLHLDFSRLVFSRSRTIASEDESRVDHMPKGSCRVAYARTSTLYVSV